MIEVRVGFRTRTAHGTTFGNYPLPCPRCSLPRPLCSPNAEHLSPSSLSLLWLARGEAIREATLPPCCPPRPPSPTFPGPWVLGPLSPCPRPRCTLPASTLRSITRHLTLSPFTLPPPGALVSRLVARMPHLTLLRPPSLYVPCPVTPLPLAGHCVGRSHACRRHAPGPRCMTLRCGSAPRRSALSSAPAHCGRLARLWGTFVLLPHACSFMPPWQALFPALPSLPLCPPASACTMWGNSRCSAPSLPLLSALAPWPCPAPCLLALPRPLVSPFPGPLVPGSRCLCPRPPFTLPAHRSRSNTRGTPLTRPSPCRSQAPWFRAHQPAARGPLLPPYLPLPPLLFSLSILTCLHYGGHFVGRPHACRRHASPSLHCLVPSLHYAEHFAGHRVGMSHARRRHAPDLCCITLRRTLHPWGWTALRQRAAVLRLVQCPRALRAARSVVGHLCASAPRSLLHAAVARPLPCPAFPVPLPSGQREHNAEQFACSASSFAPSLCPSPLALSCPLSARPPLSSRAPLPRSLGPWPSVSLSPPSLYPLGIHFAEQYARHPSHSPFTLPLPGALVPSAPARSLRPSTPALPPPPSPALFPLYTPQDTTHDTL